MEHTERPRNATVGANISMTLKLSGTLAAIAFLGSAALLTILACCMPSQSLPQQNLPSLESQHDLPSLASHILRSCFLQHSIADFAICGLALSAFDVQQDISLTIFHCNSVIECDHVFSLSFVLLGRLVRTAGTRGLGIIRLRNCRCGRWRWRVIVAPQQVARQRERIIRIIEIVRNFIKSP